MRLIIIAIVCWSLVLGTMTLQPERMTNTLLQQLKNYEDYVHHMVFFNQDVFNKVVEEYQTQVEEMSGHKDIKFYINDCKVNPMKECQNNENVPVMLLFNRIFIRFNGGKSQHQIQEIYEWMVSRIAMSPVLITSKQQLQTQLNQTPELFCYCVGNQQQKAVFYSLSKAMILTSYCVIDNKTLYEELGLKSGNITLFKNGTLDQRTEFQHQNRYDMWEMFLKINVVNHVKKSQELLRKRYSQQNKNIDTTVVLCDFSFKCEQFWKQFQSWSRTFQQQHPDKPITLTFFDQKQILLYNVYFHTIVNHTRFPALFNVKILSENGKAGWFRRYISYPEKVGNFFVYSSDGQEILRFLKDIDEGKVPEVFLSGEIPAKNGFTGKNSQKLIQKVVAKNLNETIAKSQKHYVLLLSSFSMGIPSTEEFYKEFKKAASFLSEEEITFGFMDIMKNEIKIDNVQTIPQVLLYNKYFKNDPQVMRGRQDFDSLMRFLENNAIINYSSDL